jgi:hypothetical protein
VIRVSADVKGARDYLRQLEQREIPRVIGRSLDRTRKSVASFVSRDLRQRIALSKGVIDQSIKTRRSGEIQNLTALALGRAWFEIRFTGKPIPLRDFSAKQVRAGVSYRISKQRGRRRYVRAGQAAFFVQRFGNNVFTRIGPEIPGPERTKIKKVMGPSLPQIASTRKLQARVIEHARATWFKEVTANAKFAISRRGR